MEGEIVYIGTMDVNGETLTGAFVMIDPDKLDGSMIYEDVSVESNSKLQALKQRLDDYKAHPIVKRRNGEEFKLYGFISIEEAKRIITNLEGK